ncbi:MAG TPA: hypothetical protein VNT23_02680 [Gaiellaceae bacterium]|nr:hypothetical protein [Gaiellaceae bacterium]
MRVFVNFTEHRGPYGGANSFLRTLCRALRARGVHVSHDLREDVDVALLNALTDDIDVAFVREIARRGIPIVHRKVGYRASGSPELRAVRDGVVEGDRRQLEFGEYVTHTIFQSRYSRDVFVAAGFEGPATVIHNGVDEAVFRTTERSWLRGERVRRYWDGREPLRVVVSTWSTDPNKGFSEYERISAAFGGRSDVQLALVGRTPSGAALDAFTLVPARTAVPLARYLRRQHVLLQLARHETCSNALIEGINCGLPVVYLDSGSNAELAGGYGVEYEGDLEDALGAIRKRYSSLVERCAANPYRASLVVEEYLAVLRTVVG